MTDLKFHLEVAKNDKNATEMKAYLKNHFEFLGIRSPLRRTIQKPWISEIQKNLKTEEKWKIVFELWKLKEREFQLVAMDLLNGFKKIEW